MDRVDPDRRKLERKRPDLVYVALLDDDAPAPWKGQVDQVFFRGRPYENEVTFCHRASRTLILTDVASNLVDLPRYERFLARISGMPAGFGPSRNARRLLLRERESAREALRAVARWPFERIVMAHGARIERDARAAFEAAFARYL